MRLGPDCSKTPTKVKTPPFETPNVPFSPFRHSKHLGDPVGFARSSAEVARPEPSADRLRAGLEAHGAGQECPGDDRSRPKEESAAFLGWFAHGFTQLQPILTHLEFWMVYGVF